MPIGLIALIALMGLVMASSSEPDTLPGGPEEEGIPSTSFEPSRVVASAFVEQLSRQGDPRAQKQISKMVDEALTIETPEWTAVLIPYGPSGGPLPEKSLLVRIADAIAEAYNAGFAAYPLHWASPQGKEVPLAAIVFSDSPFTQMPDIETLSATVQEHYDAPEISYGAVNLGSLLGLAVQTIAASAIGTVVSMGTQDLVHAMGGKRRAARLAQRYRRLESEGSPRARKVLEKLARIMSRIKGRTFDKNEIEALLQDL